MKMIIKAFGYKIKQITQEFTLLLDILFVFGIFIFLILKYHTNWLTLLVTSLLSFLIVIRTKTQYQKASKVDKNLSLGMQLRLIISLLLSVIPAMMFIHLILGVS